MKITFLTSSHHHNDDRICYNMANSLSKQKHEIEIISSLSEYATKGNITFNCFDGANISKKEKIKKYLKLLSNSEPDIIICSEPITVLAAKKHKSSKKVNVIFDITEWYPSKKNLRNHKLIFRPIFFLIYFLFFVYALKKTDSFIFGEYYKSVFPKFLFPKKEFEYISYYPKLEYLPSKKHTLKKEVLRLSYSGRLSIEKGFLNFIKVIENISVKKNIAIKIDLIGYFDNKDEKKCLSALKNLNKNVAVKIHPAQDLKKFYEIIAETDIFLDLRSNDIENTHCLPIKIFNYMAMGRPVIYSNLKAIKKVLNINEFGLFTKPDNHEKIANHIIEYINNNKLYERHCNKAKLESDTKYNWNIEELKLIRFINHLRPLKND